MYAQIIDIIPSPRKYKKYRARFITRYGEIREIDFGFHGSTTYIDGATDLERKNYLKRHLANPTEKVLIETNTISPALLSARLLWGKHRSLEMNVEDLNNELKNI